MPTVVSRPKIFSSNNTSESYRNASASAAVHSSTRATNCKPTLEPWRTRLERHFTLGRRSAQHDGDVQPVAHSVFTRWRPCCHSRHLQEPYEFQVHSRVESGGAPPRSKTLARGLRGLSMNRSFQIRM